MKLTQTTAASLRSTRASWWGPIRSPSVWRSSPTPQELTRSLSLNGGLSLQLRPIRPDDALALAIMAQRTAPEDLRLRFHGALREMPPGGLQRLTQIDYAREMAFVAVEPSGEIAGVGRIVFDPDFDAAEYAILVRTDMQGRGLGRALMQALIVYATSKGARRMWGDVLSGNANMLTLARAMGATSISSGANVRTAFDLENVRA